MVLILCSVLSIIKCIYIHECFKIEFVSEFIYFIQVFNTKDYYNCLSLIEPCLENQSVNTRAGGGGRAFDIINEHLYTPCMLRLFFKQSNH